MRIRLPFPLPLEKADLLLEPAVPLCFRKEEQAHVLIKGNTQGMPGALAEPGHCTADAAAAELTGSFGYDGLHTAAGGWHDNWTGERTCEWGRRRRRIRS